MTVAEQRPPRVWHFIALVGIIVTAWAMGGYWASGRTDPGRFGDMFGAVNALFSGLAFAGVIYAILLQRHELALQRRELDLTRQVLMEQELQLRAQNDTLRLQTFESTFSQLLNLHNEIVGNIKILAGTDREKRGRECFREFYNYWIITFQEVSKTALHDSALAQIEKAYLEFYKENQANIGPYLAHLYQLIKFVNESKVTSKRRYTDLVAAHLSTYERLLLFYHCLSSLGRAEFKSLIREFDLLRSLSTDLLLRGDHASLF